MERHLNSPTRAKAALWLRKVHGWIGLWGATLGLLFGFSGIWLNHRAVLPLKPAAERGESQLALPEPAPVDAKAMAAWLQSSLSLQQPVGNVRVDKARPAPWAEASAAAAAMQPAHWTFNFNAPRGRVAAVVRWIQR